MQINHETTHIKKQTIITSKTYFLQVIIDCENAY